MKILFWIIGIIVVLWLLSSTFSSSSSTSYSTGRYDEHDGEYTSDIEDKITSENWICTDDCSGHEAGYDWAADNGITSPDDCGGNSESFIEGCEAYANEQEIEDAQEYDDYDIDQYFDY